MGYHDNEATTKKAVKYACQFINDRERYRYALSQALGALGQSKVNQEKIIEDVRKCDFTSLTNVTENIYDY